MGKIPIFKNFAFKGTYRDCQGDGSFDNISKDIPER